MTNTQLAVGLTAGIALAALLAVLVLAVKLRATRRDLADLHQWLGDTLPRLCEWARDADHDLDWAVRTLQNRSKPAQTPQLPTDTNPLPGVRHNGVRRAHGATAAGRHRQDRTR